jgi:hypothetical protein
MDWFGWLLSLIPGGTEAFDTLLHGAATNRGIPSTMKIITVGGDVALKNAVLKPGTLLRLDDDLFGHAGLLSGERVQAGDQNYAQDKPYPMRRSA